MALLQYEFDVQLYGIATNVTTECIDISLTNLGTNIAYVRGVALTQGQSISLSGNVGEVINNPINIYFEPAGAGTNILQVVRRFYL